MGIFSWLKKKPKQEPDQPIKEVEVVEEEVVVELPDEPVEIEIEVEVPVEVEPEPQVEIEIEVPAEVEVKAVVVEEPKLARGTDAQKAKRPSRTATGVTPARPMGLSQSRCPSCEARVSPNNTMCPWCKKAIER